LSAKVVKQCVEVMEEQQSNNNKPRALQGYNREVEVVKREEKFVIVDGVRKKLGAIKK